MLTRDKKTVIPVWIPDLSVKTWRDKKKKILKIIIQVTILAGKVKSHRPPVSTIPVSLQITVR